MLDDSSQNGAVACWVPGGPGHGSPPAGGSCDASWGSAFPSVVYAQFKWQGDVLAPLKRWEGVTRFVDNEYSRTKTTGKVPGIKNIFAGLGDWVSAVRWWCFLDLILCKRSSSKAIAIAAQQHRQPGLRRRAQARLQGLGRLQLHS